MVGASGVTPPPTLDAMTESTDPYDRPPTSPLPAPTDPYAGGPYPPGYSQPGYSQPGYSPPGYDQPGYAQPGYAQEGYGQPVPYAAGYPAFDPATGLPLSDKSKIVAGILQLVLGGFGAGRFYTGHIGMAIAQIAVTWLTCGLGAIWPLIDGIILLVQGGTDAQGRVLRSS